MNTIPTVGPDASIAPRTGSGSPQTPPQQRADAAPAVLADSLTKADPGVMLKLVAPVLSQEAQGGVRKQETTDPLKGLIAYLFGAKGDAAPTQQRQAPRVGVADLPQLPDEASPEQVLDWLAKLAGLDLDPDALVVARAIASSKQLPAHVQEAIREASDPAIAKLLRFAAMTEEGIRDAPARIRTDAGALANAPEQAMERLLSAIRQSDAFALVAQIREQLSPERQLTGTALTSPQQAPQAQPAQGPQARGQLAQGQLAQGQELAQGTQRMDEGSALLQTPTTPLNAQTIEAGLRDALRLLMDGRMLWQGDFTPGVPGRFERSDAWQTNREALGGMEKGTSFRAVLELPHLGRVELRALGFSSQVSVRLSVPSPSAAAMTQALPALQKRLRDRQLAAVQIAIEPQ